MVDELSLKLSAILGGIEGKPLEKIMVKFDENSDFVLFVTFLETKSENEITFLLKQYLEKQNNSTFLFDFVGR